jgi:diguanylate cyclase (GGDEF)-like protein
MPIAAIYLAHRSYVAQQNERRNVEFLHQSTQLLHASTDANWAVDALLTQARKRFQADVAALVYLPAGDPASMAISILGPGDNHRALSTVARGEVWDAWSRVGSEAAARIIGRADDTAATRKLIGGTVLRDGMIVALKGEGDLVGYLLVANRLSDVSRFSRNDLLVMETIGQHVGVGLDNGQLEQSVQQLRILERQISYRSTHDPLTGLQNRALLVERLSARGAAPGIAPAAFAVIWIDISAGAMGSDAPVADQDKVRLIVSQRLTGRIRGDDLAARIDDDHFVVLAETPGGEPDALRLARRVRDALSATLNLDGAGATLRLTVGVALNRRDEEARALLDRAARTASDVVLDNDTTQAATPATRWR